MVKMKAFIMQKNSEFVFFKSHVFWTGTQEDKHSQKS